MPVTGHARLQPLLAVTDDALVPDPVLEEPLTAKAK
jgi:hypothetical protein